MNSTYGYNNWWKWPSLACKRGHVCQPQGFMYGTFPTSGRMQHPSFAVAQGLWLAAYLPTNHDSLPPNPSSLIFIFNFLSISDLQLSKSTYIWICESARVGSCVQLFYIPWSCVRCSDYITAEVCCISMHSVHSQTQTHANILNCSSESCPIAFPRLAWSWKRCTSVSIPSVGALPDHWPSSLSSRAWTSARRVSFLHEFQNAYYIIFFSASVLPSICKCLVKRSN
jgi:hypothetical protein